MTDSVRMARLVNLMRVFREEKSKTPLTSDEEMILSYIVERIGEEKTTTVSNLVASQKFGTPPTVQKKVDQLVSKDLLVLVRCTKDSRKLNLTPTTTAIEYFDNLSHQLLANPLL